MAKLSPVELAELVTLYKFPDRATAVAVILGESGGDPSATNREPGNIDRGLWQISSKWHPNVTDAEAFDVQASTVHALRISSGGTDFNPWHATKAPAFAGHQRTAAAAVAEYDAEGAGRAGGSSGSWGEDDRPWWQKLPVVPLTDIDVGTVTGAAGGAIDAVTGGVGDVLGYAGKALALITSPDFWRRAGFALAGVVLLGIGLVVIFGRPAARLSPAGAIAGAADLDE